MAPLRLQPGPPLEEQTTLLAPWLAHWAARPAQPVLHDPTAGWLSAAELEERSARAAAALVARGVGPGDRVLLSTASTAASVVAYVGALRAGAVVVPANTAYREPEVAHVVGDARPRAAIVDEEARARWVRTASSGPVTIVGPEDLWGAPPGPGTLPELAGEDLALLIYTSGTTGRPKGAALSHRNLASGAASLVQAWRWTPEDQLVHALPLFHLHGLGAGLHGTLHAGAAVDLRPRFDAGDVLARAAAPGATLFFGVPTMYERLVRAPGVEALGRLRLCVSGSAPLSGPLFRAVQERAGTTLLERYGTTETFLTLSNPYEGERRPGTVGVALPGVEARVADGELEVRGPTVSAGYWEHPDATARARTDDGWWRTGDLVAIDDDGYVRIVGRRTELIISGGYNVYPREVEDALLEHPAVGEAAVAGVPDERWGEQVTAWVVATDALTEADLLAFARERLAPYKCPKQVRFVDALPRNALGKVQKHQLG
jgi:malonyl-CoA/methylmalonyl-CoA synthetase